MALPYVLENLKNLFTSVSTVQTAVEAAQSTADNAQSAADKAQSTADAAQAALERAMPIGAVYVQYGGQKPPDELFGGEWQDISETYAGRFFRVAGGDAAEFGQNQEGGAPNIYGWFSAGGTHSGFYNLGNAGTKAFFTEKNQLTAGYPLEGGGIGTCSNTVTFSATRYSSLYKTITEVRPINHTVRIWKRTA